MDRRPADDAVRRRAVTELGTTFLVEAGAGTGKTRLLVDRYVACLADGAPIASVAAITFTEKAAGELRQRIRQELEKRLGGGELQGDVGLPQGQAALFEAALADLDRAPISTIHSFAGGLLREHPVEAGIDPAPSQLDELGSRLLLESAWETWLGSLLDQTSEGVPGAASAIAAALSAVLAAEIGLDDLRSLAFKRFRERYSLASEVSPVAPELAPSIAALRGQAANVAAGSQACINPDDRLLTAVTGLCAAVDLLPTSGAAGVLGEALCALSAGAREFAGKNLGRAGDWPGPDKAEMLVLRDDLLVALDLAAADYRDYVGRLALTVAAAFSDHAQRLQTARGALDFDDLLGKARDLLRGDPSRPERVAEVRGALQRSFRYLLVDEFQDTDPLQAEIVFFLAEREPLARVWREVELEPGKLFLVGDPKQSIYRFRRADIAIYHEVAAALTRQGGQMLDLTQNFRTVPSVIAYVNRVFDHLMGPHEVPGLQPAYSRLEPWHDEPPGPGKVVVVHAAEASEKLRADERRRIEAETIAGLLAGLGETGWQVRDDDGLRPASLEDVALLFRTFTGVAYYERALRDAGLPYAVEGGRTYFARREVADTLTCLRAVDDIVDPVAVYGALHSSLFGHSDDDLFTFNLAGGTFDCYASQPPGFEVIEEAFDLLRSLHQARDRRPLAATVDDLLRRSSHLEAVAAWSDQPRQALANLGKLRRLAADCDAHGTLGMTFHAFVRELRDQMHDGIAGEPLDEASGSGVRLLTIHKAKGLEFPIVVLADADGGFSAPDTNPPLLDRIRGRLECSLKGGAYARSSGSSTVVRYETADYADRLAAETKALASERLRLLYVALTRAKDVLVVPVAELPPSDRQNSLLQLLAAHLPGRDATSDEVVRVERAAGPGRGAPRPAPVRSDVVRILAERERWLAARTVLLEGLRGDQVALSPSRLQGSDTATAETSAVTRHGLASRRVARALGSAVHRVLELVPLHDDTELGGLSAYAAAEAGAADRRADVERLARAVWRSPPLRAAATCPHHREFPLRYLAAGRIVTGVIDLAYRCDGDWVLVDYKTDRSPVDDEIVARHGRQAQAYVRGFEAATGEAVSAFVFVLADAVAADGSAHTLSIAIDNAFREGLRNEVVLDPPPA